MYTSYCTQRAALMPRTTLATLVFTSMYDVLPCMCSVITSECPGHDEVQMNSQNDNLSIMLAFSTRWLVSKVAQ